MLSRDISDKTRLIGIMVITGFAIVSASVTVACFSRLLCADQSKHGEFRLSFLISAIVSGLFSIVTFINIIIFECVMDKDSMQLTLMSPRSMSWASLGPEFIMPLLSTLFNRRDCELIHGDLYPDGGGRLSRRETVKIISSTMCCMFIFNDYSRSYNQNCHLFI
jgi:hypothetical protein